MVEQTLVTLKFLAGGNHINVTYIRTVSCIKVTINNILIFTLGLQYLIISVRAVQNFILYKYS